MRAVVVVVLAFALVAACGETRRPLGEECLRDDDCLSGTCADRTCVAAPNLVTGAEGTPPDETPRIPDGDASSGPKDAGDAG